ncbi:MAG: hypothetical protein M0P39_08395 [Rhodocyclaceae bacterium]|nr:hypothetical protein [Rhodocyclaceae bacterium]
MSPAPADVEANNVHLARQWLDRAISLPCSGKPAMIARAADMAGAVAATCLEALRRGQSLLIVAPDDKSLPDLSAALDLSIRPLCLVLPNDDFTARITLRATLALLRSRLARSEEQDAGIWAAQRNRLAQRDELWRKTLAWSATESADPWPETSEGLFPIRVVPAIRAARLIDAADIAVVLDGAPLASAALAQSRILQIDAPRPHAPFLGALAEADPDVHFRATVEAVTREIAELELELATVQGELAEFTARYRQSIGDRLVELDTLQAELALRQASCSKDDPLAQDRAAQAHARAEQSRNEQRRYREAAAEREAAFTPSTELKKLFRRVAQQIHPDRARDEADRSWRTRLMAEANRAYRHNDAAALRDVLAFWDEGRTDSELPESGRSLMESQLERLQRRLAQIQDELDRIFASRLYELFVAAKQAQRLQRDLLQEMADKLDLDIAAVRARLATAKPA